VGSLHANYLQSNPVSGAITNVNGHQKFCSVQRERYRGWLAAELRPSNFAATDLAGWLRVTATLCDGEARSKR
jgi:hypothetical protein